MKRVLYILCLLSFFGCKKKKVNEVVVISVVNFGTVVPNPTIQMTKGLDSYLNTPSKGYDLTVTGDASGQYIFENLSPDIYYFFASSPSGTKVLLGSIATDVKSAKAPNRRELKIYIE